jgi:signal transduction histidine kinase
MRHHFRTLRGRLSALALLVATIAVAALTVAFNVLLADSLDSDANGRLRSQAAAAATTVVSDHGRLRVREAPDDDAIDQTVWVYEGGRAVVRPPGNAELQRAADALAGGSKRLVDLPGRELRLYALPVARGGAHGTVVAGLSLNPYERTTNAALVGSIGLALVLLTAVGVMTWVTIGRALTPVTDMTRSADDWGAHDLDRRFGDADRPDELGQLAATFDRLLDRVATSLRHEQRLSAELSHELRTPLSRVIAESELALRRERTPEEYRASLELVHASARQLSGIVDALVSAARHEAGGVQGTADATAAATGAIDACAPLAEERRIQVELVEPPRPLRVGADAELVERILQPVVENACRYGRHAALVRIARSGNRVSFEVEDDGPGLAPEEEARIFEPGVRGSAGGNGVAGAGLGLALARRLAQSAAGDVKALPGRSGRFVVTLPTA